MVAVTFLGIFAFLVASIPAELVADQGRKTVSYPENWDSSDVYYLAETFNLTDTGISSDTDFELGGRTQHIAGIQVTYNQTQLHYVTYFLWIFRSEESCLWIDTNNVQLSSSHPYGLDWAQVDDEYGIDGAHFIAKFQDYKLQVVFSYDNGTYTSFEDAYINDAIYFWVGVQFDQVNTSYNAWDIIGLLLFFQLPNVHWAVNAIIAIPLWIVIAYATYILILRAIGAIFGGGGA